jgi:hypothetical protein
MRFLSEFYFLIILNFTVFWPENILFKMACFVSLPRYRKKLFCFLKAINRLVYKYLNQKNMLVVLEVVALLAVIILPLFPAKKTANK